MMIDTMNYPLTDEYDLNLWLDDNNKVKLTAYKLLWTEGEQGKELTSGSGEEFYTLSLTTLEVIAMNSPEIEDEWNTRSGFHAMVYGWGGKVPPRIQEFLMTLPPYVAETN
jgi:hypothetical protein